MSPKHQAIQAALNASWSEHVHVVDDGATPPSARAPTLEMTNAGWLALKEVFARFGVDIMKLPFDHSAGFLNSDAPTEIYAAMRAAQSRPR